MEMLVDAIDRLASAPLRVNHGLEIRRRIVKLKPRSQFGGEPSGEPRVKYLVAVAEGDRAGSNDGNDFTFLDPIEEIVPESLVEFTQHTTRRFQGLFCMAYLPPTACSIAIAELETLTGSLPRRMATLRRNSCTIPLILVPNADHNHPKALFLEVFCL